MYRYFYRSVGGRPVGLLTAGRGTALSNLKRYHRPETSRIVLRVGSNPRQLSAGQMAELLEKDAALREHASADLDLDLESFAAGDAEVSWGSR